MPPSHAATAAPAQPALNLKVAGGISRSQLKNLSVIYGSQALIPIDLYDTLLVPTANTGVYFSFFQQTRGQAGIWNTNMQNAGQLISKQIFVATEIRLDVTQLAPAATYLADMMSLTHGPGSFTLFINQVEMAQGLIKDLIGGGLFVATTTANFYAASRAGATGRGYDLNPALVIPTEMQFSLVFNYPNGAPPVPTVATYMRAKLSGQLLRLASA